MYTGRHTIPGTDIRIGRHRMKEICSQNVRQVVADNGSGKREDRQTDSQSACLSISLAVVSKTNNRSDFIFFTHTHTHTLGPDLVN